MITVMCDKHRNSYREFGRSIGLKDSYPPSSQMTDEEFAKLTTLLIKGMREWPDSEEQKECSDCYIIGLSKRGRLEKLDSPDDWFLS